MKLSPIKKTWLVMVGIALAFSILALGSRFWQVTIITALSLTGCRAIFLLVKWKFEDANDK